MYVLCVGFHVSYPSILIKSLHVRVLISFIITKLKFKRLKKTKLTVDHMVPRGSDKMRTAVFLTLCPALMALLDIPTLTQTQIPLPFQQWLKHTISKILFEILL